MTTDVMSIAMVNGRRLVTVGVVAKLLGLTRQGVRLLDDELRPIRAGRIRLYDLSHVEIVHARRAAQRARKAVQR